jgi:hypothetical protein
LFAHAQSFHTLSQSSSDIVEEYYFPRETKRQVKECGMIPIVYQPGKAVVLDHVPKQLEKDALELGLEVKEIIDKKATMDEVKYKVLWKSSWVSEETLARLEKKKLA